MKTKNEAPSTGQWPGHRMQPSSAHPADPWKIPFFSQCVFRFQGEGNGLGHCASVLSSMAWTERNSEVISVTSWEPLAILRWF